LDILNKRVMPSLNEKNIEPLASQTGRGTWRKKILPVLPGGFISAFFFCAGFLCLPDYGITWDEKETYLAGFVNLEIIRSFWSSASITYPWHELTGYYFVFDSLRGIFADLTCTRWHLLELAESYHLFHLFLSSLSIYFLYLLVLNVSNSVRVAFFTALTLALFPKFLAHAQNNPKDLTALFVFVVTIYMIVNVVLKGGVLRSIGAGCMLGLALTTTTLSVFIPFIVLAWLLFSMRGALVERMKEYFILLFFCGIFFYLFWPWLWDAPVTKLFEAVEHIVSFTVPFKTLYFGTIYTGENMPWHYFIMTFIVVTPVFYLFCFIISPVILYRISFNKKEKIKSLAILGFVWTGCLVVVEMMVSSHYDGIRHFLPVLPAFCILVGTGIESIFRCLEKICNQGMRRAMLWAVSIIIIFGYLQVLSSMVQIHPYQNAYLNGITNYFIKDNAENYFEIEYWGQTYREGALWMNQNMEENATVCVPKSSSSAFVMNYYLNKEAPPAFSADFFYDTSTPKYVLLLSRKANYSNFMHKINAEYLPVYTIRRQKGSLAKIFKNTEKKQIK
jgi:hypothetical protein